MKRMMRRTGMAGFAAQSAVSMVSVVSVALAAFAAPSAGAGVVAQCERAGVVVDGQGLVTAWVSTGGGGAAFTPALAGSPAWTLPTLAAGGVAFDKGGGAPASPLASGAAGVATLFLVVDPAAAGEAFSTLVEAPGASVTAAAHASPQTYDPDGAAGLAVRVDGAATLAFPAARHIVEVDFPQAVGGGGVRIGGASACAGSSAACSPA